MRKNITHFKLKKKIIIILLLPLIFIGSLWYYENYILVDNVFDYMYYSRAERKLFINETFSDKKYFEIDDVLLPFKEYYAEYDIYVDSKYDYKYTSSKDFEFEIEDAYISFVYTIFIEETEEHPYKDTVTFKYSHYPHYNNFSSKFTLEREFLNNSTQDFICNEYKKSEELLSERGITAEDLEAIHHWLLYERILNDFFTYNEGKTRFSMNDLGDIKIAELNTYYEDGVIDTF